MQTCSACCSIRRGAVSRRSAQRWRIETQCPEMAHRDAVLADQAPRRSARRSSTKTQCPQIKHQDAVPVDQASKAAARTERRPVQPPGGLQGLLPRPRGPPAPPPQAGPLPGLHPSSLPGRLLPGILPDSTASRLNNPPPRPQEPSHKAQPAPKPVCARAHRVPATAGLAFKPGAGTTLQPSFCTCC